MATYDSQALIKKLQDEHHYVRMDHAEWVPTDRATVHLMYNVDRVIDQDNGDKQLIFQKPGVSGLTFTKRIPDSALGYNYGNILMLHETVISKERIKDLHGASIVQYYIRFTGVYDCPPEYKEIFRYDHHVTTIPQLKALRSLMAMELKLYLEGLDIAIRGLVDGEGGSA